MPGPDPIFHAPNEPHGRLQSGFVVDEDRLAGYADALSTAGVSTDAVPIVECRAETIETALPGAAMLFDRAPDVTAVLAMTDVQAMAVIEEARRRGISIPDDLSVVGFDDLPEAKSSQPPLTTVVHPMVEKGRAAARIVFEAAKPEHVKLPASLAIRSSSGPVRLRS